MKKTFLISISHFTQLMTQFIIIRTLNFEYGPSIYGVFIIITGVLNLSSQITLFPLNNFFQIRFVVQNKFNLKDFVLKYSSVIFSFFISLIGLLIFKEFKLHVLVYGISFLIFTLQYNSILVYFNSKSKHEIFSSFKIIHNIIYGTTVLLSCYYFSVDLNNLFVILIFMYLFEFILVLFYLNVKNLVDVQFPNPFKLILNVNFYSNIIKKTSIYLEYALPLSLIAVLTYIIGSSERYFTKFYFTDEMVGIYSAIYLIATKPYVFSKGIIETIFKPKMYMFLNDNSSRQQSFHQHRFYWLIVCTLIIFAGLIFNIFFWELYSIIIPDVFLQYKNLFVTLTLAYLPFLCGQYYRRLLLRSSENKILLKIEIFTAILTLLLYFVVCIFTPTLFSLSLVPLFVFTFRFLLLLISSYKLENAYKI